MDIFIIIPENFFSLLNSKRKRIYSLSIFQVYKTYQSESIKGIDKKIIVDDLTIFLDKDRTLVDFEDDYLDYEEIKEEDIDKTNTREIANYILRKMELTGWIFIDVDNDYQEILNFTDHAITVIECLLSLRPKVVMAENNDFEPYNPEEFQGYIFTVWSLLNNMNDFNHSLVLNEVLKNTKQLVNFLRKIDFRIRQATRCRSMRRANVDGHKVITVLCPFSLADQYFRLLKKSIETSRCSRK